MSVSDEESFVILGSSPIPSISSPLSSLNSPRDASFNKTELQDESVKTSVKDTTQVADPVADDSGSKEMKSMLQSAIFMNSEQKELKLASAKESTTNGLGSSLAASFLLGEINSDVLKSSVYSQFPSLCSTEASADDVNKLQNFMSEYVQLKNTMSKVNVTIKEFYTQTKQWKDEMEEKQSQHKALLLECHEQIAMLRDENVKLKQELDVKLDETVNNDEVRRREHVELIHSVSEKMALIGNMTRQIEKLETQNLASFEYIPKPENNLQENPEYLPMSEHLRLIKEIERKLSELLAENLDLKDLQKQYIDEINCLKFNLDATEELLKESKSDIQNLQVEVKENKDLLSQYEVDKNLMKEDITILRQQVDVYRKDFEMERISRQNLAGEKDQLISDLRTLQRKNHELIVEEQKRLQEKSVGKPKASSTTVKEQKGTGIKTSPSPFQKSIATETTPQSQFSQSQQSTQTTDDMTNRCPICNAKFVSLSILQKHVNECLDKN